MGFCVCLFSPHSLPSFSLPHSWIHDARNKVAHCTLHQSGIQGSGSNVILCPILNSSQRWEMTSAQSLTHSDNYHCKQSSAGPKSNAEELRLCVCEQCLDVAATKRGREMLAATVLNLFLTGAEFIHPHKHHFSAPPLIYWFILYGIRIAPLIDSIHTQGFP